MKKLTALVVLGLLAACDDIDAALARRLDGGRNDGGTDGGSASLDGICRNGFCWEYPLPQGNDLKAVWGKNASDVWMVGSVGTVFHWNGTRLENHSLSFPANTQLNSVWSNGDVVLVVGETQPNSTGAPMRPMRLADGVWVAETWNDGPPPELMSVRGNGLDIRAVGVGGVIAKRSPDGVWQPRIFELLPDASANVSLTSIAFDDAGTCLVAARGDLHGIGPCNGGPLELTFEASSDVGLNALWSTGPGVFHAGVTKQISPIIAEGQLWSRSANGGWTQALDAGTGCTAGFAQGPVSVAYCGRGELWRERPPMRGPVTGLNNEYVSYYGLWTPEDTFEGGWLVGGNGAMMRHQGDQWVQRREGVGANISAVWVDDQRSVAVADGALVFHRSSVDGRWAVGGIGSNLDLKDLWIAPDDSFRVYVGVDRGLFEGPNGIRPTSVLTDGGVTLNAVWGSSKNDLWAVGGKGEIWHRDGAGWSRNTFFPDGGPDLFDIDGLPDGGAYIVGQGCVVLRRDPSAGSGWLNLQVPDCTDDLYGVWAAPQNDAGLELVTVGSAGDRSWIRRNGTWSATNPFARGALYSVWGTSPTNIYAAGEDGALSVFSGNDWTTIETGTRWRLSSVRGRALFSGSTELILVGDNATVLRSTK